MCWYVFSPDAGGPSLSVSLSLTKRASSARRRNTIVTHLRLLPLSPSFRLACFYQTSVKVKRYRHCKFSLSRGPYKYARHTCVPELWKNHCAALRSRSRCPLLETRQPVWVNSMRRTWAETFWFQSRCELSGFSLSKEKHRRVVVTRMQSLQCVSPILFQHTVTFVVAVHWLLATLWYNRTSMQGKNEEEEEEGGEAFRKSRKRGWHTAHWAQTHCPLHPN